MEVSRRSIIGGIGVVMLGWLGIRSTSSRREEEPSEYGYGGQPATPTETPAESTTIVSPTATVTQVTSTAVTLHDTEIPAGTTTEHTTATATPTETEKPEQPDSSTTTETATTTSPTICDVDDFGEQGYGQYGYGGKTSC